MKNQRKEVKTSVNCSVNIPQTPCGKETDMLVVACIKQVPDTTQVKIDPNTGTLIREGVPFIMNPFDTHALEECLRLKDRYGFRVAVISMGPSNTVSTLRKALAVGADEVVLLSDRVFGGADTLATSRVLAEVIKRLNQKEEVLMVICGRQTIDGDTAQVGPGIATRLRYSQLTLVDQIQKVDRQTRKVIVRRKLEGRHEVVEAPLPPLNFIKIGQLCPLIVAKPIITC